MTILYICLGFLLGCLVGAWVIFRFLARLGKAALDVPTRPYVTPDGTIVREIDHDH